MKFVPPSLLFVAILLTGCGRNSLPLKPTQIADVVRDVENYPVIPVTLEPRADQIRVGQIDPVFPADILKTTVIGKNIQSNKIG